MGIFLGWEVRKSAEVLLFYGGFVSGCLPIWSHIFIQDFFPCLFLTLPLKVCLLRLDNNLWTLFYTNWLIVINGFLEVLNLRWLYLRCGDLTVARMMRICLLLLWNLWRKATVIYGVLTSWRCGWFPFYARGWFFVKSLIHLFLSLHIFINLNKGH